MKAREDTIQTVSVKPVSIISEQDQIPVTFSQTKPSGETTQEIASGYQVSTQLPKRLDEDDNKFHTDDEQQEPTSPLSYQRGPRIKGKKSTKNQEEIGIIKETLAENDDEFTDVNLDDQLKGVQSVATREIGELDIQV